MCYFRTGAAVPAQAVQPPAACAGRQRSSARGGGCRSRQHSPGAVGQIRQRSATALPRP